MQERPREIGCIEILLFAQYDAGLVRFRENHNPVRVVIQTAGKNLYGIRMTPFGRQHGMNHLDNKKPRHLSIAGLVDNYKHRDKSLSLLCVLV